MFDPFSAAIAVGGNLAGALINKRAAEKANQTNRDLAGFNAEQQEEFAKMGVRWKVADAKAAGIHPLVALGAQTTSFSPVGVGSVADTSVGDAVRNMGQDLSRARTATLSEEERQLSTLQIQSAQLDLQGKALDNAIKNSTLRKLDQAGPSFPSSGSDSFISGQGNAGSRILEKKMERTMSLPGSPHSEPGALPDLGWGKTATGLVPLPSKDAKERIEDVMPHEFAHYWRNNVAPNWGGGTTPPKEALPKGATRWKWNHFSQEFQPWYPSSDKPGSYLPRSWDMRSKKLKY